ncbi:hypothetical protein [Cellulomonas endophytica]|uniref:hypothetical protein n=1 Tax=Cellulomonas endophytica TaxID=2494735 RepID=UPI0010112B3E|nr:hypothetical protein [Cellulomonas endophytica]
MTTGEGPRDGAAAWREERREAAAAHERALVARQRAESEAAGVLIAAFLERARVDGPPPVPLRALSYDRRRRFRTPLEGWYLRRDGAVGVDTDGRFYVLTAPTSLAALVRGVRPEPSPPPLVIGAGGRDGDSIDLADALERVLTGEG